MAITNFETLFFSLKVFVQYKDTIFKPDETMFSWNKISSGYHCIVFLILIMCGGGGGGGINYQQAEPDTPIVNIPSDSAGI